MKILQDEDIVHAISNNRNDSDVGSTHPGGGENIPSLLLGNKKVIKRAQNGEGPLMHSGGLGT